MWGRARHGLLRYGGRAPRAAAPLSASAAVALRPGCCFPPSSPSSPSSPSLSNGVSCASPAPPRAVDRADFAPPLEVAVGDGLVFADAPPPPPQADPTLLQPRVVLYDGVSHLCHAGVKWVIEADKYKKIKFCCVQSKAAEPYLRLCGLDREDVLRRFLFVEGLYSYYQGSTAKRRYDWFGKEEDCIIVQVKVLLDRFIDRDELLRNDRNEFL